MRREASIKGIANSETLDEWAAYTRSMVDMYATESEYSTKELQGLMEKLRSESGRKNNVFWTYCHGRLKTDEQRVVFEDQNEVFHYDSVAVSLHVEGFRLFNMEIFSHNIRNLKETAFPEVLESRLSQPFVASSCEKYLHPLLIVWFLRPF